MSIPDLFACTFAKTIYKLPSCIVTIKSEIVSKVDDPALRLDFMCIHELT